MNDDRINLPRFWEASYLTSIMKIMLAYLVMLLALNIALSVEPKVDPETGMIRVLFMGDALMEAGFVTPLMAEDPMIDLNPVPVEFLTGEYQTISVAARTLRVYFPRVERQVTEGYDVVIITDAREPFFPEKIQRWVNKGVLEYGLGFLMAGGPQSFGGSLNHPSWQGTTIGEILPVDCHRDFWTLDKKYHLVVPEEHKDHPLVKNIPWNTIPLFCRNRVTARQGSVVVGKTDRYPANSPVLVYSEMGEGMSEAFVHDWGGNGPEDFHRSDFAPIIVSNMIYWIARVEIPQDMSLVMELRTSLTRFFSVRRYAISVIDFAEKFGANTQKASNTLMESEESRKKVIRFYVNGEYEEALAAVENGLESLDKASTQAMEAKDEALFWVYVIEWFTVSGTSMLSGAVLWTLMVRRSAYKEVKTTSFKS